MKDKISNKERKLAWKRDKRERREALKEQYKNAPWYIRIPRLYLLKPFIALVLISAIGFGAFQLIMGLVLNTVVENKNAAVDPAKIEALSPKDKDGEKRIDAVAPVAKDDTWTISVYISGSNLEDMGENDLSGAVRAQIEEIKTQREKASVETQKNRLSGFTKELKDNNLDMPAYLYYPVKPVEKEGEEEQKSEIAEDPGAASTDIAEMTSDTWSDNITIVIQTGGATRWSNSNVNPNRTQRFVYRKGDLKKVYDEPIERVTDPKTLTSFLNFCKEEYPADHNMLVLWNHGGASFGYGHDSIYEGMMSLKDIRAGLEGAYKPNKEKPAFDIIGFDACLMSSLEVTHALNGFASYYAVSAETEPGEGWDYAPWLKAMTEDPTMSPAKVGQKIADSYMDYYMTQNVNMGWLLLQNVTFSVLDANKCEELYNAWCDLSKKQLTDAAKDNSVLAEIGRCSNKSTHYCPSEYNVYNTIDLGNYANHMADTYPDESSRIKKLVKEAVIYHRESGSLSDSEGISVYTPGSVESFSGLLMCLRYINEICDDPATKALYYYKVSGCLTQEMQDYLASLTDDKMKTLDLKPFTEFERAEPKTTENGFEIPADDKVREMLQSYNVELAFIDEDAGQIVNYGRDELARLDGEGNLDCEFDGTWICLDGVPLATEVISSTSSTVEYRSRILYNEKEAYLSFSWDRDAEEFNIDGVRGVAPMDLSGGIFNAEFLPDPVNYLMNSRMNTQLKKGDIITPIYETSPLSNDDDKNKNDEGKEKAEEIKIKKSTEITTEKLKTGYYIAAAVISDYRGDVYYSQVVGNKVSGGKVSERSVDSDYVGRDY